MKKRLFLLVALFLLVVLASCEPEVVETITYTVTFETGEGATTIDEQIIDNGGKVTEPEDPTRPGYVFSGKWMNGSFEWNFDLDIVTDDLTLVAEWLEISSSPSEIMMVDEAFTSSISWMQTDADLQTFTVSIKPVDGMSFTVIEGTYDIDTTNLMHVVTFTPTVTPQGGEYIVKIEVAGENPVESDVMMFGGAGTESNPYLVSSINDMLTILDDADYSDQHFLQINDILSTLTEPIEINDARKLAFSGTYDGDNYSISFSGNGGLFHEITETGVVKNLVILATTTLYAAELNLYPIGAVSDSNAGLIDNIDSRAILENPRLQGALPVFTAVDTLDHTTGAGGIVGSNEDSGIIRNVTVGGAGSVKAGRGVGGVAAYNFGLIEHAHVTATLPAGNQANSGNSSNTYSYGGGIAGFNFGTIQYASVSGRVFAQSAYSAAGTGNEGKNVAFGGIAGYNEGLITNSSFARSNSAKEYIDKGRATELGDSANNLGVASIHGDLYVGGIAGINAGEISNVYVGGALIGGRDFVGGITGLTLGTASITNAYVFAEVSIKDDGGLKVTAANEKTTATTYEIAPSGFAVESTVFKRLLNSETNLTWVPGDLAAPKLPEFTASDKDKVGNMFALSGVLLWQQGSVTGIDLALATTVLPFGVELQLAYTIIPASAPDLFVIWTSSDETVVLVHGDGLIEGVGEGTATVTATTRDGGFTDTIEVTVEDYVHVGTVTVTSTEITLPTPNNIDDRQPIDIGTIINFVVEVLPAEAQYKNYTLTSSNSRAVVSGNQVSFVYGNTGPGNVSITVSFEDSSVASLEYRFLTVQPVVDPVDVPISSVSISATEITLPEPNNDLVRQDIEINSVINIVVDNILPVDATNKNYTVTVSNSRGTVVGNQVTFITLGLISVYVTFEDTSVGVSGVFNFRFTIVAAPVDPVDIPITSVSITSPEITLPEANNSVLVRPQVEIGTVINIVVDNILPVDATNKNYTITTSNSRAEAVGNQITFVYGLTGPGSVSVIVTFEDTTVGISGVMEYRFTTIAAPVVTDIPMTSVTISATEITLPEPNNDLIRQDIVIGSVINIVVDNILPVDATNKNYTITLSNTRGTVVGNEVTFSTLGLISVYVTFEDTAVGVSGVFNFRFTIVAAPVNVSISSVSITSPEVTLPEVNNIAVRPTIEIGTVINIVVDNILPVDATNKNYTITTSNSRAEVVGNQITFVYGLTGPGNVSVVVTFEDTSVGLNGVMEYRFATVAAPVNISISSVTITATEITLPEPNNDLVRQDIVINSVINILVNILPVDATNQNYTVTVSNSRGTVVGNQVTFITTGLISVYVTFEDTSVGVNGVFNFRFTIIN